VDRLLRSAAPLILLGFAGLTWFERWIPGRAWVAAQFGEDAVLRFVLGCVCVYAAVLIWERQQLAGLFQQVLGQFKRFHEAQARGVPAGSALAGSALAGSALAGSALAGSAEAGARREAIRILAAALRSDDPEVRQSARENLIRLVGRDHGEDPAAWRAAVDPPYPDA
jgi:hypothetical protein